MTGRWSALAARPSTPCGCGAPRRPTISTSRSSARGDFVGALVGSIAAQTLTRVLYPDDSTEMGQGLRFAQEYFLVACSLADLVRRFRRDNADWTALPDKVAIQLNDTHPALAVPELMRILLDDAQLGWDQAWDLTQRTLAYTNHTLLPEALEKWPLHYFQQMLPRHLEIIYEINRRFLDDVRRRFPGDEAPRRAREPDRGGRRRTRSAWPTWRSSARTAPTASRRSIPSCCARRRSATWPRCFPERFNNKTNGVTPRRWLLLANPELSRVITEAIGDGWITDFDKIAKLRPARRRRRFRDASCEAKREAKAQFADWLQATSGQVGRPGQHLRLSDQAHPRIQAAVAQRAAHRRAVQPAAREPEPGDDAAHLLLRRQSGAGLPARQAHHQVHQQSGWHDRRRSRMRGRLKVVFLPEYCVSLAERLIPAADVSNQISTAGYEASGTSNMKFMMNGALTVGTRDGATIEMAEEAGEENFFLFGLTAEQVADSRGWYNPHWHYENEPETRAALDLIAGDHFSRNEPGVFTPLRDTLLKHGDHYMHLADLTAYLEADRALCALYADRDGVGAQGDPECRGSGKFSSDRTIAQYAAEIWQAEALSGDLGGPSDMALSPLAGKPAPNGDAG